MSPQEKAEKMRVAKAVKQAERADSKMVAERKEAAEEQKAAGQTKKQGSKKAKKKRNWAFVLYPESAPQDWLELLQKTGLSCAVSPLHDKDVDADGEVKKPHYHVIACYSGPTSFDVVKQITDGLNAPIPQALEQVRGYYRYFTHKDNPDKHQYDEKDILTVNGFNIADFVELSKSEVNTIKRMLQELIRQNDITEYCTLMDYLQDTEQHFEYDVAGSNTIFFSTYISSRRNMAKEARRT